MNTTRTFPDRRASRACSARGDTALVLCGGGHGALGVGFVRALSDLGVRYDQILGTSIGAVNGAFLAGGMSADGRLERIPAAARGLDLSLAQGVQLGAAIFRPFLHAQIGKAAS
ncbi:hypothetical protein GE300_12090 [Rhodobacteraceae bacterium 2CG4]|uniref:PNPLA domain-containing protein n=1 Tax=Halovulum marinum TaxID=2662447 RepID=A0A6L5Z2Q1_9RHOB|nr:patatin-like phospholipase family protein [Halovulum marinum]MSU90350.1 hypothetical protein [Halovulum marinum]